jgi:hypothetical protein
LPDADTIAYGARSTTASSPSPTGSNNNNNNDGNDGRRSNGGDGMDPTAIISMRDMEDGSSSNGITVQLSFQRRFGAGGDDDGGNNDELGRVPLLESGNNAIINNKNKTNHHGSYLSSS